MDRIVIRELLVRCVLGVDDEERREMQDVLITVALHADLRRPGARRWRSRASRRRHDRRSHRRTRSDSAPRGTTVRDEAPETRIPIPVGHTTPGPCCDHDSII